MTSASDARRSCPTRADGAEVLIAHTIPIATCQDRQRGMYHKCFACAYHGVGATMAPLRKLPQLADLDAGLRKVPRTAAVG